MTTSAETTANTVLFWRLAHVLRERPFDADALETLHGIMVTTTSKVLQSQIYNLLTSPRHKTAYTAIGTWVEALPERDAYRDTPSESPGSPWVPELPADCQAAISDTVA